MKKKTNNRFFSPLQQLLLTWLLILLAGWLTLIVLDYFGKLISILVSAGLIAYLLNYAVVKLEPFLSRGFAAALVYLLAGIAIAVIGLTIVPPVLNQAQQFTVRIPELLESGQQQLAEFQIWSRARNLPFDVEILQQQLLVQVQTQVQSIAAQGFGLVLGTFNGVLDLIIVLVISFYMLLDSNRIWRSMTIILSPTIRECLTESLQYNLQRFISGQLLLGLFMAITLTLAFFWLKVPFFLLFAVFIGLLEIIPFVGATLGIAAVTIIVVFIDWWLALEVLGVAIAIQQVKDNLVTPRIMGNLTGLSPVVIFIALLLGAKVGGLLGVILAIPLTGVVKSIAEIVFDPNLPPQTGSFFHNPLIPDPPTQLLESNQETNQSE